MSRRIRHAAAVIAVASILLLGGLLALQLAASAVVRRLPLAGTVGVAEAAFGRQLLEGWATVSRLGQVLAFCSLATLVLASALFVGHRPRPHDLVAQGSTWR